MVVCVLIQSGSQRGLGLQGSGLKNAGLQDRRIGALGLHGCSVGLHLARIIIFVRAPSTERLWAPGYTAKISGIQGSKDPPFENPCSGHHRDKSIPFNCSLIPRTSGSLDHSCPAARRVPALRCPVTTKKQI